MRNFNTLKPEQVKLKPLPPDCVEHVSHWRDGTIGGVIVHGMIHYPKWGTHVAIRCKRTGNIIGEGWAACGVHDEPNKRVGYRIAHNRAVKQVLRSQSAITFSGLVMDQVQRNRDDEYITADTLRNAGAV